MAQWYCTLRAQIQGKLAELCFKRGDMESATAGFEKALRTLGRYVPNSMPLIVLNVKSSMKLVEALYQYDTLTRLNDSRFGDSARDVSNIEDYIKMGMIRLEKVKLPEPYQTESFSKKILVMGGGVTGVGTFPPGLSLGVLGEFIEVGGVKFPSIAAVVQAYKKDKDVHILATPQLLTTDNEEASINVGQEVPFVTGSFTNAGQGAGSRGTKSTRHKNRGGCENSCMSTILPMPAMPAPMRGA